VGREDPGAWTCAAVPIVPGPGVEQRRPVHRLFREIGQFWVDFHPGGLAVRPNLSGRLGPVHVVECARAHHCDTGRRRNVSEPAVAMRAKVRGGDIAALGLAVIAHRLAGRNLEILVAPRSSIWTMPLLRNAGSPCNGSCRPSQDRMLPRYGRLSPAPVPAPFRR